MALNEGFWQTGTEGTAARMNSCLLRWGNTGDKPSPAPDYKGSLYWDIDTDILYYCTGTAWVDFAVRDHDNSKHSDIDQSLLKTNSPGFAGLRMIKSGTSDAITLKTWNSASLSGDRTIDFRTNNGNRSIILHGDLSIPTNGFTVSGGHGLTLNTTAATNATLPSGTKTLASTADITTHAATAQTPTSHGHSKHSDINQSLLTSSSPTFAGATINSMPVGDNLSTQIKYSEASVSVTGWNSSPDWGYKQILNLTAQKHGACTIYVGSANTTGVYIEITIDGTKVHELQVKTYDSFPLIFTAIFNHSLKIAVTNNIQWDSRTLYNVRILGNYST